MKRDLLDYNLKSILETALSIQVGMSDVPAQLPNVPYIILNQSPSPAPEGSFAVPEDMPYLDYAIKSVGRDHKETARTSSRVRSVMVDRRNGDWIYPVTVAEFHIVDRRTVSLGSILKSAGPDLFEVNDIYRFCVMEVAIP